MTDENSFSDFKCSKIEPPIFLRCLSPDFENQRYQNDDFETATSVEQAEVEASVRRCLQAARDAQEADPRGPVLQRELHVSFLKKGLCHLPTSLEVLDASRPWLCYWILHSLELLGEEFPKETRTGVIEFLRACQHPEGGFGGGPGQEAHLAPTYAAVNALCILRCREAYDVIDREKLLQFLYRMRRSDGAFMMHEGSEADIRGVYCALSVAMLTSVWSEELTKKTAHWISWCQTYEGGFGGVPDMEAHGGYTFCGLAALLLLGEGRLINMHRMARWLVNRQGRYEGGFQGRTNKLVDSCYSFWQGGSFPLLHRLLSRTEPDLTSIDHWLFHQNALQEFLLVNCQAPHGGLIDKPEKSRDFYHTCYALSGLSVAQHFNCGPRIVDCVLGVKENELVYTHPIYNICVASAVEAINHFQVLAFPSTPGGGDTTDSD